MDLFLNLLKYAAPIIGSAFGPVGTAIGGLASGLIGSFQQQNAANQAERLASMYAQNAQAIANQIMGNISSKGALKNMIEGASDILGGKLAASGLTGSCCNPLTGLFLFRLVNESGCWTCYSCGVAIP